MRIIVIGASSGYGKGIAEALEKEHVVIKLSRTLNGFDVTNPNIVSDFFENIDTVDAIIYSAGIAIGNSTVEEGELYRLAASIQDECRWINECCQIRLTQTIKTRFVYTHWFYCLFLLLQRRGGLLRLKSCCTQRYAGA